MREQIKTRSPLVGIHQYRYPKCLRPRPDAILAANHQAPLLDVQPDPVQFVRCRLGLSPDPKQSWLLTGHHHRLIVNCSRQWGKSTITAALVLHRLLREPGSQVLLVGPIERQSILFVSKVKAFVQQLGLPVRRDGENKVSVKLPNGSRIVGLPGRHAANVRGFGGISWLIIDEASALKDDVYHAIFPAVSVTDADIWILSTPLGKRGFFYNNWTHGGTRWERISVPATECPRIPASVLEEARVTMGDQLVRQEFLCEFIDVDGAVFSRDNIEESFSPLVSVLPAA